MDQRVVVEEQRVTTAGERQTLIVRGGEAAIVGVAHEAHAWKCLGDHVRGAVVRTVVDDDHLVERRL